MISTTVKDKLQIGVENVKVYDKDNVVISGKYASGEYYYNNGTKTNATAEGTATAGADEASLDKATRVAFLEATAYNDDNTVTYATSGGKKYAIASTCTTTDHNYEALKELGYTGTTSEYETYDNGQINLGDTTNFHTVTSANGAKTTKDGSFTYGSVDVYVWFDGTDKACTNAIFSQTLTMK